MNRMLVLLMAVSGLGSVVAQDEEPIDTSAPQSPRTWTSVDERTIQATMVDFTPYDVTLLLANRKEVIVPFSKLIPADKEYVEKFADLRSYRQSQYAPKMRATSRIQAFRTDYPLKAMRVYVRNGDQKSIDNVEVVIACCEDPREYVKRIEYDEIQIFGKKRYTLNFNELEEKEIDMDWVHGTGSSTLDNLEFIGIVVQVWVDDVLVAYHSNKGTLGGFAAEPSNRGKFGGSKRTGMALTRPKDDSPSSIGRRPSLSGATL